MPKPACSASGQRYTNLIAHNARAAVTAGVLLFLGACVTAPSGPPTAAEAPVGRSPFTEPRGVVVNAAVTQESIASTICISGWTATVRPPTSYTNRVKRAMLQQAGLDLSSADKYELDHFVPLALGGHPTSIDNLWLQSWDGAWSARLKDRLERTLQLHVCAGRIRLDEARSAIQRGWKAAYKKYVENAPAPRGLDLDIEERVE